MIEWLKEHAGRISRLLIIMTVIIWTAWAIVAAVLGGPLDTISAHVRDYATQYTLIAFGIGFVAGHWIWPQGPAVRRDDL